MKIKFIILPLVTVVLMTLIMAQEVTPVPKESITVSKFPPLLKVIGLILIPIVALIASAILLKNKLKDKLWLKWGLLLEIFLIGQTISLLICNYTLTCQGQEWCGIECTFPVFPQFYLAMALKLNLIIVSILSIISYFLIGSLIGLIIQKIKNNNKNAKNNS
ncbi:MAG TPA: hypothetical protein VJ438_04240 [Candidatus Nanoarchaeia archaeon]|nr:hypothetical protein [Candidatus Nanoarchaeia archaeon]